MRKILATGGPMSYGSALEPSEETVEKVGERVGALYRDHSAAAFRFAVHVTGHREDAEDAVQFAFLAVHRTLLRGDHVANPRAWIFQAVKRRAYNLRRDRHDVPASHTLEQLAAQTANTSDAFHELERVRSILWALPESQHQVFVLRHWSGLTYQEIAEVVGTTPTAVESLLHRARSALLAERDLGTTCQSIRSQLSLSQSLSQTHLAHVRRCRGCRTAQTRLARAVGIAAMLELAPGLHVGRALAATMPGFQTTAAIGGVGGGAGVSVSAAVPQAAPMAGAGAATASPAAAVAGSVSTSMATGAGVVAKAALAAKAVLTALAVAGSVAVAHAEGHAIVGAAVSQLHKVESHMGGGRANTGTHLRGQESSRANGGSPGAAAAGHKPVLKQTKGHGANANTPPAGRAAHANRAGRANAHAGAGSGQPPAPPGAPAGKGPPAGAGSAGHHGTAVPPGSGHGQPAGGTSHSPVTADRCVAHHGDAQGGRP